MPKAMAGHSIRSIIIGNSLSFPVGDQGRHHNAGQAQNGYSMGVRSSVESGYAEIPNTLLAALE